MVTGASVKDFLGRTFLDIRAEDGKRELWFDGPAFSLVMYHDQDCCENVRLEDIIGDLTDLVGSPILSATEETNRGNEPRAGEDSWTWTFYTFRTIKGTVTLRWIGESNGYYSEEVDIRWEQTPTLPKPN